VNVLGKIFSRGSALALAVAGAVAGALGYLTHNWFMAVIIGLSILLAVLLVLIVLHYVRREREAGLEEGLAKAEEEERHAQSQADLSRIGALQAKFLGRSTASRRTSARRAGVTSCRGSCSSATRTRARARSWPVRARPACAVRAPRLRPHRHSRVRARERADRPRHEQPT
jgi:hypothetical protein